ncbi:MAG: hypothetical protein ACLFPE_01530 [Bacteroidales bacterium]
MKRFLLIIPVLLMMIVACQRREPVSQFHTFPNGVWERFQYLNFELPVEDTRELYDISVVIRYTDEFPEDVLTINFVMTGPVGEERIRDYNFILKDRDGNFTGNSKDGLYERVITLREDIRFHGEGNVKIEMESLMTKFFTPGILEIGIVMEEAD